MPSYPLTETIRAIANADGKAVATLGPIRAFEKWHITGVTVSSTSSTLVPELREWRNAEGAHLIGTSRSGDLDSGTADVQLQTGEQVVYVWTNCDVGAECQITVNGNRTLP